MRIIRVLLCWLLFVPLVASAGFVENGPLLQPDFWTNRNPQGETLLLQGKELELYQESIRRSGLGVRDLWQYPAEIASAQIISDLADPWVLKQKLYRKGKLLTEQEKLQLQENCNLEALMGKPRTQAVRYGVTVQHASVRNLPSGEGLFPDPEDRHYDQVQDSTLETGEPVLILHESRDGSFYYVQLYNLTGWIEKTEIALCSRKKWEEYVAPSAFLVVTGRSFTLRNCAHDVFYLMGARLPLLQEKQNFWQVTVPGRDQATGALEEAAVWLPKNAALHKGFLPYTTNQIIRQAFKFYGAVYGWGGADQSVDCSSLVGAVYRTLGLTLPRNSAALRAAPGVSMDFQGLNRRERLAALAHLSPGTVLHLKGHTMLYLGMYGGRPYVLHAASSYYENGRKIYVRKVAVSDLDLGRENGSTFLDALVKGVEYRSLQ